MTFYVSAPFEKNEKRLSVLQNQEVKSSFNVHMIFYSQDLMNPGKKYT